MRRGVPTTLLLALTLLAAVACGADDEVSNLASEQLDSLPTDPTDPPAPTTTDPTDPTSTDPTSTDPTSPTSAEQPPTGPTTPGTVSNSLPPPGTVTPETVDVEVPPDCTDLPAEAPAIIVTDDEGVVYQVGSGGTQIIADSQSLPSTIDAAWRAADGALWVGLDPAAGAVGASVGRLDANAFTEIATGNVNVQHVGTIDDVPVALWFDYDADRAVIEDAAGDQRTVSEDSTDAFRIGTGGIGGDGVALTENSATGERFRYVDVDGDPIDWFNPTARGAGRDPGFPEYTMATPSPDGELMSWGEAPVYDAGTGEYDGEWNLVVARTDDGTETFRLEVGQPEDFISTGDFDGRWFLVSLTSGTLLVDTTEQGRSAAIVPCIPRGSATLDRSGGGGGEPPPTTTSTTAPSGPPSTDLTPNTTPGNPGVDP